MTVRVRELMEHAGGMGLELVAGAGGLDRPVRWVHMVENVEIAGFLEGQEIAFITGIGLEREGDLLTLVRHMDEVDASGVVVNIGPFIRRIDPEVVGLCDDRDLPLFRVPWSVHMARIMHRFCLDITLSERTDIGLASALRNAIVQPEREDLYLDFLEDNGFPRDWNYTVAVLQVSDPEEVDGSADDGLVRNRIRQSIENLLTFRDWHAAVLSLDDVLIVVFAQYDADEVESMTRWCIEASLPMLDGGRRLYAGIGKRTRSARCIGKSYAQAIRLERLQRGRGVAGRPLAYARMGVTKLLLSVPDRDVIEDYVEHTVGPLLEYDRLNGTDLAAVLRLYLARSGSVKETAAELFVHRNTVTYKLRRIEEVLGEDLSDFGVRERLNVGLCAAEILDCWTSGGRGAASVARRP